MGECVPSTRASHRAARASTCIPISPVRSARLGTRRAHSFRSPANVAAAGKSAAQDGSPMSQVLAQPYTARQCPECKLWIYTDDGPFSEDDPTKTEADYLHWRDEHMDIEDRGAPVIGFPFFTFNDEVVYATKEHRDP